MINLPTTFAAAVEADVLAYARECVRVGRDEKITLFGVELYWFDKLENRRFAREMLKSFARQPDGLGMLDLLSLARVGWDLAEEAARELIIEYGQRTETLSVPLQAYCLEITDPRRARHHRIRARKKSDHFLRDIAICAIVGAVCAKFGLPPTRRPGATRGALSGCKAVARALRDEKITSPGGVHGGEEVVIAIWARLGRIAFPGGLAALRPF